MFIIYTNMFSVMKSRKGYISKNVKKKIQNSYLKFIANDVKTKQVTAHSKQYRQIYFYPIIHMSVPSLVQQNSVIYLCSTFLYSDAKTEDNTLSLDFPVYKYKLPTETFLTTYIDGHVNSYECDQNSNLGLFYKIFDNFETRILCHILITYFSNLVKTTTLYIHNNGYNLSIIHIMPPDIESINVTNCFKKLYRYLEMQQKIQVTELSIIKSLTMSVVEEATNGSKYPYNIKITFQLSINHLQPVLEENIVNFQKTFSDVIKTKFVQN